ncbi:MAG: hypothetical protein ACI94Y_001092 [Maribacter sp.]|jgi:hypothetical protein
MKKYSKYIYGSLIGVLIFGAGCWLTFEYLTQSRTSVEEQSSVLLEKVKTVAKLVSVEGYFSEIYTYKNDWEPVPNPVYSPIFSKKAITIVKAKVSVGYDLKKMTFEADHTNKVLRIGNIPDPEIISLDHDMEYYDVQVSTFNKFTKEEINQINAKAKEFIREKALESGLMLQAEKEGNQMIEIIAFMVKEAGWTVEYGNDIQDLTPNPFND